MLLPLIALLLTLASSTIHAQCAPNSWTFHPNVVGSDLESADFDWQNVRRYLKQKRGFDLTSIKSKSSMRVFEAAAWNILTIEMHTSFKRPFPDFVLTKLKSTSTVEGYTTILDETKFPRLGEASYCIRNFEMITN